MSKIDKNLNTSIKSDIPHTILDTLELTSDYFKSKNHERHYTQAIRKGLQLTKLKHLIDVSTVKRQKEYWKTYHCDRVKLQQGDKLKGSLCRKRWCQHCNRIKTAELLKGYHKPLIDLSKDGLYFVTLTAPTVKERELRSEIKKRYKAFTRIKDNIRKNYGIKINGIRKTEVTYNEKDNKYHPHFHIIVQGQYEAELIQSLWLKQFTRADIKAQDIRHIDTKEAKNLVEVFKYATKDVTKDTITARAMDIIYRALEGIRTIQTYGSIRKVKEPTESDTINTTVDWNKARLEIWVYDPDEMDYINAYNERLIQTQNIIHHAQENKQKSKERDYVFNEDDLRTKRAIQGVSRKE